MKKFRLKALTLLIALTSVGLSNGVHTDAVINLHDLQKTGPVKFTGGNFVQNKTNTSNSPVRLTSQIQNDNNMNNMANKPTFLATLAKHGLQPNNNPVVNNQLKENVDKLSKVVNKGEDVVDDLGDVVNNVEKNLASGKKSNTSKKNDKNNAIKIDDENDAKNINLKSDGIGNNKKNYKDLSKQIENLSKGKIKSLPNLNTSAGKLLENLNKLNEKLKKLEDDEKLASKLKSGSAIVKELIEACINDDYVDDLKELIKDKDVEPEDKLDDVQEIVSDQISDIIRQLKSIKSSSIEKIGYGGKDPKKLNSGDKKRKLKKISKFKKNLKDLFEKYKGFVNDEDEKDEKDDEDVEDEKDVEDVEDDKKTKNNKNKKNDIKNNLKNITGGNKGKKINPLEQRSKKQTPEADKSPVDVKTMNNVKNPATPVQTSTPLTYEQAFDNFKLNKVKVEDLVGNQLFRFIKTYTAGTTKNLLEVLAKYKEAIRTNNQPLIQACIVKLKQAWTQQGISDNDIDLIFKQNIDPLESLAKSYLQWLNENNSLNDANFSYAKYAEKNQLDQKVEDIYTLRVKLFAKFAHFFDSAHTESTWEGYIANNKKIFNNLSSAFEIAIDQEKRQVGDSNMSVLYSMWNFSDPVNNNNGKPPEERIKALLDAANEYIQRNLVVSAYNNPYKRTYFKEFESAIKKSLNDNLSKEDGVKSKIESENRIISRYKNLRTIFDMCKILYEKRIMEHSDQAPLRLRVFDYLFYRAIPYKWRCEFVRTNQNAYAGVDGTLDVHKMFDVTTDSTVPAHIAWQRDSSCSGVYKRMLDNFELFFKELERNNVDVSISLLDDSTSNFARSRAAFILDKESVRNLLMAMVPVISFMYEFMKFMLTDLNSLELDDINRCYTYSNDAERKNMLRFLWVAKRYYAEKSKLGDAIDPSVKNSKLDSDVNLGLGNWFNNWGSSTSRRTNNILDVAYYLAIFNWISFKTFYLGDNAANLAHNGSNGIVFDGITAATVIGGFQDVLDDSTAVNFKTSRLSNFANPGGNISFLFDDIANVSSVAAYTLRAFSNGKMFEGLSNLATRIKTTLRGGLTAEEASKQAAFLDHNDRLLKTVAKVPTAADDRYGATAAAGTYFTNANMLTIANPLASGVDYSSFDRILMYLFNPLKLDAQDSILIEVNLTTAADAAKLNHLGLINADTAASQLNWRQFEAVINGFIERKDTGVGGIDSNNAFAPLAYSIEKQYHLNDNIEFATISGATYTPSTAKYDLKGPETTSMNSFYNFANGLSGFMSDRVASLMNGDVSVTSDNLQIANTKASADNILFDKSAKSIFVGTSYAQDGIVPQMSGDNFVYLNEYLQGHSNVLKLPCGPNESFAFAPERAFTYFSKPNTNDGSRWLFKIEDEIKLTTNENNRITDAASENPAMANNLRQLFNEFQSFSKTSPLQADQFMNMLGMFVDKFRR